jgi:ABC-type uncharacterized transport system ATPase subunit
MADMIEIKHLNKYFGDLHVLKDINLTVKRGEKLVRAADDYGHVSADGAGLRRGYGAA